jgi:hypothetical protein
MPVLVCSSKARARSFVRFRQMELLSPRQPTGAREHYTARDPAHQRPIHPLSNLDATADSGGAATVGLRSVRERVVAVQEPARHRLSGAFIKPSANPGAIFENEMFHERISRSGKFL